jgi:hypothetical protein
MKTSLIGAGSGVINTPFSSTSFYLDADYEWMKLTISFSKKGWYSLFVWDPAGKIRSQCIYINERKEIILSAYDGETSFSSVPGSILTGEWKLEVLAATFKAEPEFKFSFECGQGAAESKAAAECTDWTDGRNDESGMFLNQFDSARVLSREQKWYKGDFHTHTTESDGKMTPEDGMAQAKKMGLDYFAVTDHNILPTKWLKDDMLTIPGVEITSSKGHFNALGLKKWIDWRPTCTDGGMETEEGMNRIISEVKEAGAIVSINHPMLKPWEWQFETTPLSAIDVIEIWNDPTYKDNPRATEEALKLWDILWNDGHRIYGIGGSDSHLRPDESYEKNGPPSVIGDPATYVFADELSADSILGGVRSGNVYVSRGPVLDCTIFVNGQSSNFGGEMAEKELTFKPGSDLSAGACHGGLIDFNYRIHYENSAEEASLIWILNGTEAKRSKLKQSGTIIEHFQWKREEQNWLRFEIRKTNGELLAFTNPVYLGQKQPTIHTWQELLKSTNFGW